MRIIRGSVIVIFILSVIIAWYGKETVKKSDTVPPVITSESDYFHVEAGTDESLLLEGLSAADDRDGDLTDEIIVGKITPFEEKGVSQVEYLVFDRSNNVGRYERTVEFDNYKSPRFQLKKPLMYKESKEILISDRLYAEDMLSGDISDKIRYSSTDLIQSVSGTYELLVEVKTSYGDEVREVLPINIIPYDFMNELIQLNTYLVYVEKGSWLNPAQYIKSVIDMNGNPVDPEQVVITPDINMNTAGSGQVRYELYNDETLLYVTYLTVIVTDQEG